MWIAFKCHTNDVSHHQFGQSHCNRAMHELLLTKHKQSSRRFGANWTDHFIEFSFYNDAGLMLRSAGEIWFDIIMYMVLRIFKCPHHHGSYTYANIQTNKHTAKHSTFDPQHMGTMFIVIIMPNVYLRLCSGFCRKSYNHVT